MANRTKKSMELRNDQIIFRFPEVHEDAELAIEFQRTLRIPDDNWHYYLPPGLGKFPLSRVDDYPDNLPETWRRTWRGVFTDVSSGGAVDQFPRRLSDGGENSGRQGQYGYRGGMGGGAQRGEPQDYLVVPGQPWLDGCGFCVQKGLIRQFVAMPLGRGLYGGRAVNRRGGTWGTSDCGLSDEDINIRRAATPTT